MVFLNFFTNKENREPEVHFTKMDDDSIDDSVLTEITNPQLVARISALISGILQSSVNAANTENYVKGIYKILIPKKIGDVTLASSHNTPGAVRAFWHNPKGVGGHADLIKIGKSQTFINAAATITSVASLAVGQYYMSHINSKLDNIYTAMSQITGFLYNEYAGKVEAIAGQIKEIVSFQTDILENEELRKETLNKLNSLEYECSKLFHQANHAITDLIKNEKPNYKQYEELTQKVNPWSCSQQILIGILYTIESLLYVFHLGTASKKHCYSIYLSLLPETESIKNNLVQWHRKQQNNFQIDRKHFRRKKLGINTVISKMPSMIGNKLKYSSISKQMVEMIDLQTCSEVFYPDLDTDVFCEDVELIFKNDRVYYIPVQSAANI